MALVTLTSRIPAIVTASTGKASMIVQKTLHDIEGNAKQRTPPRVDTGQMMNGWTTTILGPFDGEVTNPVEYSIFHELGTERIPAHPMLAPAVEDAREPFERALAQIYR